MSTAIGALHANLSASSVAFERDMGKARQAVQKNGKAMSTAMDGVSRSFGTTLGSMINLKKVAAGLSAYLGARTVISLGKNFLDVASAIDEMRIRLKILLGSAEEGGKLFDDLATFAGKVPFELREVMESATMLAGIMKGGRTEIMGWMPLIGDLAAATGLGIQETTEQMMRMLSAGAASADKFRERGVLAMLGFQSGVSYSAKQTGEMVWHEWSKSDSKIRGAMEELAGTWKGTMSMFSDAWFQFNKQIADKGSWETLGNAARDALDALKKMEEEGTLDEWAVFIDSSIKTGVTAIRGIVTAANHVVSVINALGGLGSVNSEQMEELAGRYTEQLEKLYALQKKIDGAVPGSKYAAALEEQLRGIQNRLLSIKAGMDFLQGKMDKPKTTPEEAAGGVSLDRPEGGGEDKKAQDKMLRAMESLEKRRVELRVDSLVKLRELEELEVRTVENAVKGKTISTEQGAKEIAVIREEYHKKSIDQIEKEDKDHLEALSKIREEEIALDKSVADGREQALERSFASGMISEKEYLSQRKAMIEDEYQSQIDLIREKLREVTSQEDETVLLIRIRVLESDKENAIAALQDMVDKGKSGIQELKDAIDGWGKSSAQAFADFAMSGKASFSDLINSMIRDMIKMVAYQQVFGPLFSALGTWAGGLTPPMDQRPGFVGPPSPFPPKKAAGGAVSAGGMYEVAERGPELLQMGNRQFLMMGEQGGQVIAAQQQGAGGGGGGCNVKVIVNNNTGQESTARQEMPKFNGQEWVVTVWLDALERNVGGMRQALGR